MAAAAVSRRRVTRPVVSVAVIKNCMRCPTLSRYEPTRFVTQANDEAKTSDENVSDQARAEHDNAGHGEETFHG